MNAIPIGVIRVLTSADRTFVSRHGDLIMQYFPGLDAHSACIPDQPEGVHDEATEAAATPKVLALARRMEQDGMKAVVVSCAGDPAVGMASSALGIPVIGAGRAAAALARTLERPVGVLGITTIVPEPIRAILGDLLVGDAVPEGVVTTLDLLKPEGMAATLEAARGLLRQGARTLLLACTGMSTIGAAQRLRTELGVPVIDPVRAESAAVWALVG